MTDTEILRAEAADRIRAMMGVTGDDPDAQRRRKIRNAANTASNCASCGRVFEPGAPVWRIRFSTGRCWGGGWGTTIAPQCQDCVWQGRQFHHSKPCGGCGRPVHNEADAVRRRHTFCSERCKARTAATAARHRRADIRGTRVCEECEESFEPARTDSRFCSVACKQRAYRRRVTNNKHLASEMLTSRNGGAP